MIQDRHRRQLPALIQLRVRFEYRKVAVSKDVLETDVEQVSSNGDSSRATEQEYWHSPYQHYRNRWISWHGIVPKIGDINSQSVPRWKLAWAVDELSAAATFTQFGDHSLNQVVWNTVLVSWWLMFPQILWSVIPWRGDVSRSFAILPWNSG
jgi:hypothetical protein